MTTITNFLHANFLTAKSNVIASEEQELPIWVINGSKTNRINVLK